jgi:hypothetical protein
MTDYVTGQLQGRQPPADELDIIEGYGGEGVRQPNRSSDTSDANYRVTSHFWNQGAAGDSQPGIATAIHMRRIGGQSAWWETFHTYGCKITSSDTIYYCDDIEVARHPTGAVSKRYPFFFMINLAVGGDGWPVDLSRYNGIADMYIDYIRVYGGAPALSLPSGKSPGPAQPRAGGGSELSYPLGSAIPPENIPDCKQGSAGTLPPILTFIASKILPGGKQDLRDQGRIPKS